MEKEGKQPCGHRLAGCYFGNNLSILALVTSDRIVYKLKNKKIDWFNEFK
jgi:hypothetical protein